MTLTMTCALRQALAVAAAAGCALPAFADDAPLALGAVYAYGKGVDVYGVQGTWAPRIPDNVMQRNGFELRFSAQVGRWVARDSGQGHDSLAYGNLLAELRYSPWRASQLRPYAELGFGPHLVSHVNIANHNLATAFNFGSQGAAGIAFGENGRYDLAAFIHHASNARIKQPNQGLTYTGVRFRVALP